MIWIKKTGEDRYTANVRPINPRSKDPTWQSPHPMTAKELAAELSKVGCDTVDIWDAFHEADPNFHT